MVKFNSTRPASPSLSKSRSLRVSRATMRKEIRSIAHRHFGAAFNEILQYYGEVNPRGHSYVDQYLRAMRDQLEWHEARRPDRRLSTASTKLAKALYGRRSRRAA